MEEVADMNIYGQVCFSFIRGAPEDSGIGWVIFYCFFFFPTLWCAVVVMLRRHFRGESDGMGFVVGAHRQLWCFQVHFSLGLIFNPAWWRPARL